MTWKNWPYWLKGGIVGLVIIFLWALLPSYIIPDKQFADPSDAFALVMFIWSIPGIIVGAIIGLFYGKIKQKRQV